MTTTLSSLPLPPSIQLKLAAAGFTSVGDFDGLSAAELAEDLAVEPREAQKLLAQVRSSLEVQPRDLKTKSALQLLNEERASNPITTFVKELDNLLGGGVALGQLTGARHTAQRYWGLGLQQGTVVCPSTTVPCCSTGAPVLQHTTQQYRAA